MKYTLLKYNNKPGCVNNYMIVMTSDDIVEVENHIKKSVIDGGRVRDYKIMQEVPFEFKCAIKLLEESV